MDGIKAREIISTFNRESIPAGCGNTFIFLWLLGQNDIQIRQVDLAEMMGIEKRTLRDHIYKLIDAQIIDSEQIYNAPNIIKLKRFKHNV